MTKEITPQPGILDIAPYKGGESAVPGVAKIHKLSSNENPLGPSKKAIAAFKAEADTLHRYPSDSHQELREAIGRVHGLDPARVIIGDGSDEVISWLCHAFAGVGDEVLYTEHGFAMYPISALTASATPVVAPEKNRRIDVDALLAAVTERTRVVFIANPGNPTATFVPEEELARLADALPGNVLLVLDGAYAEYVPGYDGGRALIDARKNVVMTRTFSKIYGLGGLRVGWCYGPQEIIDILNRMRGPFNVASPGLAAAKAAIEDHDWLQHCLSENATSGAYLTSELTKLGIKVDPSFTNFILARFEDAEAANAAEAALKSAGVIVRKVAGYGLPQALRITIGDSEACALLVETLSKHLKGSR